MAIQKSILAGGCFWGMQPLINISNGIISTEVGYTGGDKNTAYYNLVKNGDTNHAEAISITFDDSIISYWDLLAIFFQIHNPTTLNKQGGEIGSQYRSVVFYTSQIQCQQAKDFIQQADDSTLWVVKIITQVVPEMPFYKAENHHQNYIQNNPNGYTCHFPRADWVLPNR